MTTGNGYGSYRTTNAADMAAYDAAPPLLRWILRNTVADWGAKPALDRWLEAEAAGMQPREMAHAMAGHIHRQEQSDTLEHYGPTHPEAPQRARGRK